MNSSEDNRNSRGVGGRGVGGGGAGPTDSPGDGRPFEERLGAEPRRVAAELRAALASGATVADGRLTDLEAAEALEGRIEGTLRAPRAPAGLVDELLAIPEQKALRRGPPAWLAMAASVALLAGVSGVVWFSLQPGEQSVADYVEAHFHHDGEAVLALVGEAGDSAKVAAVMASLGATAGAELTGRIRYIKFCPTPDSQGAHMVVATAEGPVTVIFMPAVTLDEPLFLSFDGVGAKVIGLERGSAAIIGASEEAARELGVQLEAGILPMGADI